MLALLCSTRGLISLARRLSDLRRNLTDCPNVRLAFKTLQDMGFKRVKVLYLPHNLTQDWIKKGFPVQKGELH